MTATLVRAARAVCSARTADAAADALRRHPIITVAPVSAAATAIAAPLIDTACADSSKGTVAPAATSRDTVDEKRSTSTTTTMSDAASRRRPVTPHSRRTW